jgi:hypothetical protein
MNTNLKNLMRRIGGFMLAALLLAGVGVASGTSAQAQRRYARRVIIVRPYRPFRPFGYPYGWYGPYGFYNQYNQYVFSNSEAADNQGYHDGFKTGSEDGRKHKSYDPERSHYFHDAGFGNYAGAFREGFSRGYRDGYGPS